MVIHNRYASLIPKSCMPFNINSFMERGQNWQMVQISGDMAELLLLRNDVIFMSITS